MNLHRFPDGASAAQACAKDILERLHARLAGAATASLAVSGGASPKVMFEYFARALFQWERIHLFWVDERGVPPDDPQSNFGMANEMWLKPGGYPPANIHRIEAELDAREAAKRYREDIRNHFRLPEGELPRFDVMHLGMGPDGHTASLFPGSPLLDGASGTADAVWAGHLNQWRITLLPGVIQAARHIAMLTMGKDKATVLRAVLQGPVDTKQFPAQLATRNPSSEWFVDREAASELKA